MTVKSVHRKICDISFNEPSACKDYVVYLGTINIQTIVIVHGDHNRATIYSPPSAILNNIVIADISQ